MFAEIFMKLSEMSTKTHTHYTCDTHGLISVKTAEEVINSHPINYLSLPLIGTYLARSVLAFQVTQGQILPSKEL